MKRSKSISLLLMGTLALGSQGCSRDVTDDLEDINAFNSVSECVSSGFFTENECKEFALNAYKETPRFNSLEECEQTFGAGQCVAPDSTSGSQVQQHSGSSWMPLLTGFMVGRMLSGGGMFGASQPLYRDTTAQAGTNSYRTATGETVQRNASGKVTNPPGSVRQSMTHVAKTPVTRAGGVKSSGGFSGGSRFGSAAS